MICFQLNIYIYFHLFILSACLCFCQVGTNMVEYLQQAEASLYPSVLVLGEPQRCSSQAFVIITGQALPESTLLPAVDVCFKAFYVFDIDTINGILHGLAPTVG